MNKDFLVSVVIPVYNEEKNISPLLKELLLVIRQYRYEIIFVDDGSQDATLTEIKKYASKNRDLKLISLLRNFGHQAALSAGYEASSGDCVITMDSDLQDPPRIIPDLIKKWKDGAKIVYARRQSRSADPVFKRASAHIFYKFINLLSDTAIPQEVGDFRLLGREVVDFLNKLPEQSRFLRGLVAWAGYPAVYVSFTRGARHAGYTHYSFSRMLNFAFEGITSFSVKPLRLSIYLGFLASASSILIIIIKSFQHFVLGAGDWLPGWASLFFSIVFLGGIQLITLGIVGEYIAKIYKEVQGRPQYIIGEKVNL